MSNELKPCPFCGEQPKLSKENGSWVIECKHHGWPQGLIPETTIAGDIDLCSWGDTEEAKEQLIEAWNTRAERTCHLERIPYEPGEYEGMRCSVCKTTDLDMGEGPYCSVCGAKVVD